MPQQAETTGAPFYARLKPFDPKRDHAMKVFVVGMRRFDAGVWAPVDEGLAKVLRRVRQSYYDELSPLAFEVVTAAEAKDQGIVAAEAEATPSVPVPPPEGGEKTTDAESRPTPRGKKGRES